MLNAIAYQNARLSYFVNRIIKRVSIKNVSRLLWSPWLNIDFDSYLQIKEKIFRQSIFLAFWKAADLILSFWIICLQEISVSIAETTTLIKTLVRIKIICS